jgi:hypothetical protein
MSHETFEPAEPFGLQTSQRVQVRSDGTDENFLTGMVVLVDSANGYVSVLFDGTTIPVAIPAAEWTFGCVVPESHVPQEDGLYVRKEEALAGTPPSSLLRRRDGHWADLLGDPTQEIPEAEIPPVMPMRPMGTTPAPAPTTNTTPIPTQPPAEEPAPEPTPEETP